MDNTKSSPFTPGNPVPVELFVGRAEQIKEILRYISQITSGRQENLFLVGDRGIGKSSLASFLRYYVNTQTDIFGVHIFLGGASTLEEMVHHIFEQILKETKGQPWYTNIKKFFGEYIREIGLFGISVSFNPPEQDLRELVRKFPEALNNILEEINKQKKGLFIILDDINGLVERPEFANWYKSFVDEIATHYKNFPVFIMLIGLPEKRDRLSNLQPSLMRIFRVIEIKKLSNEEVKDFIYRAFSKVNMRVEPEAMEIMVFYSSGLPILMHEIGDATFWTDTDGVIDKEDAEKGILVAAQKVGEKYLDPKVYRAIRSQRYKSILRKLGEMKIPRTFKKKDVESQLDPGERRVFHNFLIKLRGSGVIEIERDEERGTYRFVNEIYPIYIWMESGSLKKIDKN
jgi:energy-coupling factor transporter ATP-binding protein EcfA2